MTEENGSPAKVSVKDIGLPTSVRHIRSHAFRNNESVHLWFKAENPPANVEAGAINEAKNFYVRFPAVMNGKVVDASATDERGVLFENGLGFKYVVYYEPAQWMLPFPEE